MISQRVTATAIRDLQLRTRARVLRGGRMRPPGGQVPQLDGPGVRPVLRPSLAQQSRQGIAGHPAVPGATVAPGHSRSPAPEAVGELDSDPRSPGCHQSGRCKHTGHAEHRRQLDGHPAVQLQRVGAFHEGPAPVQSKPKCRPRGLPRPGPGARPPAWLVVAPSRRRRVRRAARFRRSGSRYAPAAMGEKSATIGDRRLSRRRAS